MGACCSTRQTGQLFGGLNVEEERNVEEDDIMVSGDCGARVRLHGSSNLVSMFTQEGGKGVNQDAMTVWENFGGERDMFFCGVFDGHGPSGHKVAHHARDTLPSKLSTSFKNSHISGSNGNDINDKNDDNDDDCHNSFYSSWKASLIESFKGTDDGLEGEYTIDSYCSGSTAVAILKQGQHMMIANLGDSRAVLCTRNKDQLASVQLTVDLKPNLPSEAERIKNCEGRVLALEEEPNVYRVWMPNQDGPGLAMSRAFGDFCLKDFGLISVPQISYRKLCDEDEFIVLATDGVWDVLSNSEVIGIVATARNRSVAAKRLVDRAVRAWRCKYPCAKVDDCSVICLFLKRQRPLITKSKSEVSQLSSNFSEVGDHHYHATMGTDDGLETLLNCDVAAEKDRAAVNGGASQVDPNVAAFGSGVKRRRLAKDF